MNNVVVPSAVNATFDKLDVAGLSIVKVTALEMLVIVHKLFPE